ncbi:hypothetical protein B0T26DRAFT_755324 [Lasiosphaeria miniovina]|uniref:CBM-cenC domain-containing protein n=1 Tax=Lasiosphaeria miniovina TaxID=1954250 RepID=A0AA40A6U7_9PEZI|nr:uncharacterized protein B0T26DRAFT_755324 [Lasiosphaeria miniovina]KAK0710233.1 hypothetical protein B0T26DRAFT_755324 [Lasiosphaeria miniovina]
MRPSQLQTLLAAAVRWAHGALAACAADNCYNQLARRTADASGFCATFTTACVAGVSQLPTYVSTSCGVARVSSACSCLWPAATTAPATVTVTTTSTVTASVCPAPTNLVANPSVAGLSPWFNGDIITSTSYGYDNPGITLAPGSPTGGAFRTSFAADGLYEWDQRVTLPSRRAAYTLSFAAQQPAGTGGCYVNPSFGVQGNGDFYEGLLQHVTPAWKTFSITYTTNGGPGGFVAIQIQCTGGEANVVLLDQVSLVAL